MVPDQYFDIITQIYYAANSKGVDDVGRFFGRLYGSLAQILAMNSKLYSVQNRVHCLRMVDL